MSEAPTAESPTDDTTETAAILVQMPSIVQNEAANEDNNRSSSTVMNQPTETNNNNNQSETGNNSSDDEQDNAQQYTNVVNQDEEQLPHFDITPSEPTTFDEDEIPNEFIFYKDKNYPQVFGSDNNSDEQLSTMSYLIYLRGLVYSRSKKASQEQRSHNIGYRFPLHNLITDDERPEIKFLCNKFYKEKKQRLRNVWFYYYPATADITHNHLTNFLKYNFPDPGEKPFIDAVHNHKNTEAFCIAVHDSIFQDATREREMKSNIIASISFRLLQDKSKSGVFVYYLSTLQEKTFDEVCTLPSFQTMKCPMEGHGMGEMLLRNTQLFCSCIRYTYATYLGVNTSNGVISFYKKLGFRQHSSPQDVASEIVNEIEDCLLLESESIDMYHLLSTNIELTNCPLNTQSLLHRHCDIIPRPIQNLSSNASDGYMKLIADLFEKQLKVRYVPPEWSERQCYEETDQHFTKMFLDSGQVIKQGAINTKQRYISNGVGWKKYHALWTKDNMVNFWDLRNHYKAMIKKNKLHEYRCQETIMPVEHFLMDNCSVQRIIKDNKCSNNKQFNLLCQFCFSPMTSNPLSLQNVEAYGTQIAQAHFTGEGSHILALNSTTEMEDFRSASTQFEIVTCVGLNERSFYTKLYKATLRDYCIHRSERQEICIGTNHLYQAFFRQYTAGEYYKEFFDRVISGCGKTLRLLDGNRFDFPPNIQELIKWAKPKDYSYAKRTEDIFDKIVDSRHKKFFENRQKPLKRRKSQDGTPKKSRQKADNYSDLALKLNWKTLMAFNAYKWDPKVQKPSCVRNVSTDKNEVHYVARSDINRELVYFVVSENIIPKDPPQYIFDDKFLNDMEINKEVPIPQSSKEKLERAVRRFQGQAIFHILPQGVIDGQHVYHGKQKNGHIDKTITQEWIDVNFKDSFPTEYQDMMDPDNVGKSIEVPSGFIDLSDSESDEDEGSKVPSKYLTNRIVRYQFENKNSCAFGNMANAVHLMNDEKAAQFFFAHRNGDMNDLRKAHTKIHQQGSINSFHLAREILRQKFKYNVRFVKGYDLVEIAQSNKQEMLYVMLLPADVIVSHVICIYKGRIVDGTFAKELHCNAETLCWLCNDSDYSFHG